MHMPLPPEWLKRLKLGPRVGQELVIEVAQTKGHPYGEALRKALNVGVSGVLCLNGSPCAAVVLPPQDYDPAWLRELYTTLWNQGELDFLLLLLPDRVDIHTLDADPRTLEESSTPLSPVLLDILRQAGDIEEIVTGLESGRFLEKKTKGFDTEARVDASLIRDLEGARDHILSSAGFGKASPAPKEFVEQIHDTLLQAMFLLYLEDRGIIEAGYIHLHSNSQANKLHELLRAHPDNFLKLLEQLDHDLNGGLFKPNPLWERHSNLLADFLQGMWNLNNGQGRLLRLYRFEHIPVELLSEVYDRFLGSEGTKKSQGAYYTPRRLAALVVEQAWESIKGRLDAGQLPRILDPSCGSGIFPALLFQRIADYLSAPAWEKLKQIAEHLHGIDVNPTAIRISAFSLYLALLHRAEPKELRALMAKGKVLPELLGKTLIHGDFFDHPVEEHYDYIIGNPPWGGEKQKSPGTGETWARKNKYPKPPQRERSWPFIWKTLAHLHEKDGLALLLPSTGFFLNDVKESLVRLLDVARLERLVDLSDLRLFLFNGAIFPACILSATRTTENQAHRFAYLCPKADLNAARAGRILLAESDQHVIDAHAFAIDSVTVTQRLMWFGPLERRLLAYLDTLPTLEDLPLLKTAPARKQAGDKKRPDWGIGMGFQSYISNGKKVSLPQLFEIPYLDVKTKFTSWVQFEKKLSNYDKDGFVLWKNYHEGFIAPHIVLLHTPHGFRLQACYAEHSFSFNNTATGITVPDSNEGRATGKFLTAFLNSAFAGWFMATRKLAVGRPKTPYANMLTLPFPRPEHLPNPEQGEAIWTSVIAKMDDLIRKAQAIQETPLHSADSFPSQQDINTLDNLIFSYLGIRPDEVATIWENLELIRKAAQPRDGDMPELWTPSKQEDWNRYCDVLGPALSAYMDSEDQAWVEVIGYSPDIAVVQIVYQPRRGAPASLPRQRAVALKQLSQNILHNLERPLGGNVYLQRCVTVFTREYILLIKPRQRRFWLMSAAQSDADHILNDILQAAGSAKDSA